MEAVTNFVSGLQSPLFATRDTIEEAYAYVTDITNGLPQEYRPAVITAVQVMINTIAEQVKIQANEANETNNVRGQ